MSIEFDQDKIYQMQSIANNLQLKKLDDIKKLFVEPVLEIMNEVLNDLQADNLNNPQKYNSTVQKLSYLKDNIFIKYEEEKRNNYPHFSEFVKYDGKSMGQDLREDLDTISELSNKFLEILIEYKPINNPDLILNNCKIIQFNCKSLLDRIENIKELKKMGVYDGDLVHQVALDTLPSESKDKYEKLEKDCNDFSNKFITPIKIQMDALLTNVINDNDESVNNNIIMNIKNNILVEYDKEFEQAFPSVQKIFINQHFTEENKKKCEELVEEFVRLKKTIEQFVDNYESILSNKEFNKLSRFSMSVDLLQSKVNHIKMDLQEDIMLSSEINYSSSLFDEFNELDGMMKMFKDMFKSNSNDMFEGKTEDEIEALKEAYDDPYNDINLDDDNNHKYY